MSVEPDESGDETVPLRFGEEAYPCDSCGQLFLTETARDIHAHSHIRE